MTAPRFSARTMPTRRTIEYLEARGYVVDIAERRQGKISIDLFGCIDLVAAHPVRREVLFIQVTSNNGGNFAARLRKTCAATRTRALLRSGAHVEVWGWSHEHAEPRVARLRLPEPAVAGKETSCTDS